MPKVTISIVSTNEWSDLDKCLRNIHDKVSPEIDAEIYVVDNASGVSGLLSEKYSDVHTLINKYPKGFAENHNNVIKRSSAEHVLIMNPDVFLKEGFIESLLKLMAKDRRTGIVMGKLLSAENGSTVDSTGLIILKTRRTLDRGQGEEDRGQYDMEGEIFAASGAAMLCRREMLEDIKLFGEYFDGSFKLYKEDLDLSWRARLRGWKVMYAPGSVALHMRGWGTAGTRANVPRWIRRESYKNRYLMMLKDDHLINFLKDLPFILWHEIKALVYILFREPHLMLAWPQILMLLPFTLRKRFEIMRKATVGANEIRRWFV